MIKYQSGDDVYLPSKKFLPSAQNDVPLPSPSNVTDLFGDFCGANAINNTLIYWDGYDKKWFKMEIGRAHV